MKDKIIAALKTTYANLGLSEKAFGGVASILEKTVTKEEDIAGAIAAPEVLTLIKAIQGESDSLRTRNAQISKELEDLKTKQEGNKLEGEKKEEDDVNAKLLARIEAMENAIKERKAKAKLEARLSEIRSRLKEGGSENENILGLVMKDASIEDDETDDKAVERLKAVYDTTYKQFYGDGSIPPMGGSGARGDSHPDQSIIDALRKNGKLPAAQ